MDGQDQHGAKPARRPGFAVKTAGIVVLLLGAVLAAGLVLAVIFFISLVTNLP